MIHSRYIVGCMYFVLCILYSCIKEIGEVIYPNYWTPATTESLDEDCYT